MTTAADSLVRVRSLKFGFGPKVIYDGIDLDIVRGKITAILGPSGTGKTTLLRLIGGQWKPDAGSIEFDGIDVHRQSRSQLFELRKRMGLLFQSGALLTDLSVYENVAFPLREHTAFPESMIRDLVLMKLEAVGLRGAAKLYPSEISGGMARRVAMARAIALEPDMIMYDEPFTGQDPISMGVLIRLIQGLNKSLDLTSVIVTHDVEDVMRIADYVYVLSGGKVLDHGSPAEVQHSKSDLVRQFLNGEADGPVSFHYKAARRYADDLMAGRE